MKFDYYGMQFAILKRVFAFRFVRRSFERFFDDADAIDSELSPVFVVGCGHSGTSLLTAILDTHSKLTAIPGETYAFRPWFRRADVGRYLSGKISETCPAAPCRPVDKTPLHVHEIERIHRFFPKARIIGVVRDGRDVVASLKRRTGNTAAAATRYAADNAPLLRHRDEEWVHIVKYEDLVTEPGASVRRILEFLGEPYEPIHETHHTIERDWYAKGGDGSEHSKRRRRQINSPIFQNIGGYREVLTEQELRMFSQRCSHVMRSLEYH